MFLSLFGLCNGEVRRGAEGGGEHVGDRIYWRGVGKAEADVRETRERLCEFRVDRLFFVELGLRRGERGAADEEEFFGACGDGGVDSGDGRGSVFDDSVGVVAVEDVLGDV